MTKKQVQPVSMIDQLGLDNPKFKADVAAAMFAIQVDHLLQEAFKASGLTPMEAADKAGIPLTRLMEIMSSGGNIKITTLARVMSVFGYVVKMSVFEETFDKRGNVQEKEVFKPVSRRPRDSQQK
jgi:predicted transcriptional regulator